MYDSIDIAKRIVNLCHEKRKEISNLKLQKLLYYVQGFSYKTLGKPAFSDDIFAWTYGPVVPSVYAHFSVYGSKNITERFNSEDLDSETEELIDSVLNLYLDSPIWKLVESTHEEDPWKYTTMVFGVDSVIPKESIKNFFVVG